MKIRRIKYCFVFLQNNIDTNLAVSKKLERPEGLALILVEKRDFSNHGRVTKFYKRKISGVQISIKKTKPVLPY